MEKQFVWSSSLFLLAVVSQSLAYYEFQARVPNGNIVPHPCKVNYVWPGLGHINPRGGGARNVFGLAFDNAGHEWTEELCWEDSDGDGKTNGEELGDPNCTWKTGETPPETLGISHPGICDPFDSEECMKKNPDVDCTIEEFKDCPRLSEPGVKELDLIFKKTNIPPTETNYFCMTFDLPNDTDHHIVANEPLLDNVNVMHHMVLYGCDDPDAEAITTPQACSMSGETSGCTTIIGVWAVGSSGTCFPENTGFRIGKSAFTRVRLEFHWNNPALRSDYTDASGMKIYYVPARPEVQDMATFVLGQRLLEIPPGQSSVEQYATCPGSCTQSMFTNTTYVTSAVNHMHYLGRSMKVEVFRDGVMIKTLTHDKHYSYDFPVEHFHDPPFEMMPGDELKTTCVFNSLSSNRYVYYGDGTSDEMCYAFLNVYPKDAFTKSTICVDIGPLTSCQRKAGAPIGECSWATFINFNHPETVKIDEELKKNCNMDGFCRPECLRLTKTLMQHPCLQGEAAKTVNYLLKRSLAGSQFLARLYSCNSATADKPDVDCSEYCDAAHQTCHDNVTDGATGSLPAAIIIFVASFFSFLM